MEKWEINRIRFNKEHADKINDRHLRRYRDISYDEVMSYFKDANTPITYPSKAVFVNIVYATLMNEYFGKNVYDCLNNYDIVQDYKDMILYKDNPNLYNQILREVVDKDFHIKHEYKLGMFLSTAKYFKQEMLNYYDIFDKFSIINGSLVYLKDNELYLTTNQSICHGVYQNGNVMTSGEVYIECERHNEAKIGDVVLQGTIYGTGICLDDSDLQYYNEETGFVEPIPCKPIGIVAEETETDDFYIKPVKVQLNEARFK